MIPKQIQKELRERFNPEGSILRQQQIRMLYILDEVAKICERNNIQYWLTAGTLLGAARHGGFIPWDDDLDICVFRKDIKRLRKVLIAELPDDLALQSHTTDKNYYHPYDKIRDLRSEMKETGDEDINYKQKGIYIDIFPIEQSHMSLVKITYSIWGRLLYGHILPKPLNIFRSLFNRCMYYSFSAIWSFCRVFDRMFPSQRWNFPYGCYFIQQPGHSIEDIIPLNKDSYVFEGKMFYCPNNVDSYLRKSYGDYNRLPNVSEIEPHITEVSIWE